MARLFRDRPLENILLPQSLEEIGLYTFGECSKLTSISLPKSIVAIEEGVFFQCSSLESVTIPDGVTRLGKSAFQYCVSLTSIVIPVSVTCIDEWAFHYCNSLLFVYYGGTEDQRWDISVYRENEALSNSRWFYNGEIPIFYSITYEPNGGSGAMNTQRVVNGDTVKLSRNVFSKENYAFAGWIDQNGVNYKNQDSITVRENVVLTAQWIRTYMITYCSNGGSGSMSPQTVYAGIQTVLQPNTFTFVNHKFMGWLDQDGSGYADYGSLTPTKDLILNAQWKRVSFIVSYNGNGGGGSMTPTVVNVGDSFSLPANSFTVPYGKLFIGWNTKEDGSGTMYYTGTEIIPTDSMTLYATWLVEPKPDLVLPMYLITIDDEAFSGGAFSYAKLSEQTTSIGWHAFADCPNLAYVYVPAKTTHIDSQAFGEIQDLTILGKANTVAQTYAQDHNFTFVVVS